MVQYGQTFDVTLEELRKDAIRGQLVKHTAQELLGYPCHIPWDQHTAIHQRKNVDRWSHFTSLIKLIYRHDEYELIAVMALMFHTSQLVQKNWHLMPT